jgi:hypothetical protein
MQTMKSDAMTCTVTKSNYYGEGSNKWNAKNIKVNKL